MLAGRSVQEPRPSPDAIVERLREGLGDAFEYAFVEHDRVVCRVRKEAWVEAVAFLREDPFLGCRFFSWLSAIDWTEAEIADAEAAAEESQEGSEEAEGSPEASEAPSAPADEAPRPDSRGIAPYFKPAGELFEVCCHLSAPERGFGVTLKTAVDKEQPRIASLTSVVPGADWHERECHEMFGIDFEGHPNLAPLYLPEDFEGHPLTKSYALGARMVKPWPGIVDVEEIPPDIEAQLEALARGEGPE